MDVNINILIKLNLYIKLKFLESYVFWRKIIYYYVCTYNILPIDEINYVLHKYVGCKLKFYKNIKPLGFYLSVLKWFTIKHF